ncbi:MAG: D-2-hydroxyacid dehydrogenase [Albidovulum sp.]
MTHHPTVILHCDNVDEALDFCRSIHSDLTFYGCDSYQGLPTLIRQTSADVLYSVRFAGTPGFPRDAILNSPTLRWVAVGGAGTDHLAGWDASKLTVTNSAGVAAGMMAEYAMGAMLHFSLNISGFAKAQAAREWISGKVTPIEGARVLIVGMGNTGKAIAQRCKAMGMHVTGVRARPTHMENADEVYGVAALPDLWVTADFIVICIPLLDSTRGIVSAAAIAAMKPGAVVIDVSRGGVVDQTALCVALSEGRLGGAALDVFEVEPLPPGSPLWSLDNIILTPHCSSVYDGWELKSLRRFCENLSRFRQGEALLNIVDPTRGY